MSAPAYPGAWHRHQRAVPLRECAQRRLGDRAPRPARADPGRPQVAGVYPVRKSIRPRPSRSSSGRSARPRARSRPARARQRRDRGAARRARRRRRTRTSTTSRRAGTRSTASRRTRRPGRCASAHGTAMAGIVAGRGGPAGLHGVAPLASLLPIQVMELQHGGLMRHDRDAARGPRPGARPERRRQPLRPRRRDPRAARRAVRGLRRLARDGRGARAPSAPAPCSSPRPATTARPARASARSRRPPPRRAGSRSARATAASALPRVGVTLGDATGVDERARTTCRWRAR